MCCEHCSAADASNTIRAIIINKRMKFQLRCEHCSAATCFHTLQAIIVRINGSASTVRQQNSRCAACHLGVIKELVTRSIPVLAQMDLELLLRLEQVRSLSFG